MFGAICWFGLKLEHLPPRQALDKRDGAFVAHAGMAGIPRNMTGIAVKLAAAGYSTHAFGKWDIGGEKRKTSPCSVFEFACRRWKNHDLPRRHGNNRRKLKTNPGKMNKMGQRPRDGDS